MRATELKTTRWPDRAGECATHIRLHPWQRSALGSPARWSPRLRMAVELMLDSPLPTLVLWGPEATVLYNDRCISLLGPQHPALLGCALRVDGGARAARIDAIEQAIADGSTHVTSSNWLDPARPSHDPAPIQLAHTRLLDGRSSVAGMWIQFHSVASPYDARMFNTLELTLPATVDAVGLAGWCWDPSSKRVELTPRASEVLGLLPDQEHALTSTDFEIVSPLDRAERRAVLAAAAASGNEFRCEFRIVRPCDNEMAWIEERGRTLRDPETGERIPTAVFWEVSDRKRSSLPRLHQDRLASARGTDTFGIAFFDSNGLVTDANDAWLHLFGLERADLLAANVRWGDGTAPGWLTLLPRSWAELLQEGAVSPHEKECVRADGSRWWGLFGAKRLGDSEGVEYVVDVTARMQAERELRDSECRLRSVMDGIPQIIWRSTEDGHWTWTSPQWAEVTGQPLTQSAGLGWLNMVHPEDRKAAHAAWDRASWEQAFEANYRLWNVAECTHRAFKTRARPVRDATGRICEWIGTSTDVEDLQQLHSRQRVLVAELQHRTRNLLALVRAVAAQTLGRDREVRQRVLPDFDQRLAALSRAQALVTRTDCERVDLEGLLRTELAALRGGADRVTLSGPRVGIPATHAQTLALATHELATNAMKYGALSAPAGELHISWGTTLLSGQERTLQLKWQESGVAMPATSTPMRRGFGRELIEEALCFTLGARTELRFGPDGVACVIELPIDSWPSPAARL
jgi:PAS domain S-box-containing protein